MLDGIEGYYPYYSNEQQGFALKFAQKNNLYISGGSDSHGTPDSEIGIGKANLNIPEEINLKIPCTKHSQSAILKTGWHLKQAVPHI